MIKAVPLCIINGVTQNCKYCLTSNVIKNVFTLNGQQRYRCKECKRRFIESYKRLAYLPETKANIVALNKEGCSNRSIARLLRICSNTVQKQILHLSALIKKPCFPPDQTYEVDELCTYIGNKNNRIWIAYAYCPESKSVVDFVIGTRNKITLQPLIDKLLLSDPGKIYTDKHQTYAALIPATLHATLCRGTNYIERNNLTLRTNLKR